MLGFDNSNAALDRFNKQKCVQIKRGNRLGQTMSRILFSILGIT